MTCGFKPIKCFDFLLKAQPHSQECLLSPPSSFDTNLEHEHDCRPRNPPQLRRINRDWLLTLLTALLGPIIFVFAPLQAAGIFLFQTFAIAGLVAMIGGAMIISANPIALVLLSIPPQREPL